MCLSTLMRASGPATMVDSPGLVPSCKRRERAAGPRPARSRSRSSWARRRRPSGRPVRAFLALWWVPAGHRPSVAEAEGRLRRLRADGPTAYAFTFRDLFPAPDASSIAELDDDLHRVQPLVVRERRQGEAFAILQEIAPLRFVEIAQLAFLVAGWTVLPGSPLRWTALGLGAIEAHIARLEHLLSIAALALARVPCVATFHAHGALGWMKLGKPVWGSLADRLDHRIAVSPHARDSAAAWLPGDYEILPNGVLIPPEATADGREHQIVFVGRQEPRKGLHVLVRAWPQIRARTGARLRIAGADPLAVRLLLTRERLPDEGIDVLGFLSQEELTGELLRAKALVAPSLGGESFGMVLTRAFACATPVVASDIDGYREVMTGDAGVSFPPGDERALAEAVKRYIVSHFKLWADDLLTAGRPLLELGQERQRVVVGDEKRFAQERLPGSVRDRGKEIDPLAPLDREAVGGGHKRLAAQHPPERPSPPASPTDWRAYAS